MIQTIKKIILSSALFGLLVAPVVAPGVVSAQILDCEGSIAECADQGAKQTDPEGDDDAEGRLGSLIETVINIFSIVVGVVSVIMIIIGGLKYITSGGDSGNVSGAKNTILYAVIGLVVVVLAQIIVRFVLQRADATG